tara:strand:+ start:1558 stop:1857 length:300 start_codon:yes stop_codon:yes gene_type:complete
MIDLLILLLRPAVACADNPKRYWYLAPIAIVAWFVDIIIAHTTWAMVAGWPKAGEVTVSHTLERLAHPFNSFDPDYNLMRQIALKINRVTKSSHIKAVL